MFDFLFKNKNEEISLMEIIEANMTKLSLSMMAIEKAENMIAKAISRSEFAVQRGSDKTMDDAYYTLNIQANPNETATEFWFNAIKRALESGECLICRLSSGLYVMDSYTTDQSVTVPVRYTNIRITSGNNSMQLNHAYNASSVLAIRLKNEKIRTYLKNVTSLHNEILEGLVTSKKIESAPKFVLTMDASVPVIQSRNPDGSIKTLTIDEYKANIKKLIESNEIQILTNSRGLQIETFELKNRTSAEDITKMSKEIFEECAIAYDIPRAVFLGEITEKADSSNEFITYAASWIKEIIEEELNAKLVGKKDYLEGEKIWIDMSKFKHVDIIESAANLDKLRAIGFNFDEILSIIGWEPIGTEFSKQRYVTKNYMNEDKEVKE